MRPAPPSNRSATILLAFLVASSVLAVTAAPPTAAATAPVAAKLTKVLWKDLNTNGHIDQVELTFNGNIQFCSVQPEDFQISFPDGEVTNAYSFTQYTGSTCTGAGTSGSVIDLNFPEEVDVDGGSQRTAQLPTVTYNPDGAAPLLDSGGLQVASFTPTCPAKATAAIACDDAVPALLMAAYAHVGGKVINVQFSEPVRGGGATGTQTTIPSDTDFALCGGPAGLKIVSSSASTGKPAFNALSQPPQRIVTLTLDFTATSETNLTQNDLTGASPLQISVGQACGAVAAPAGPGIYDMHVTGGLTPDTKVTGIVPVGSPQIKAVHGNPGDPDLLVEYTGPVDDGNGNSVLYAGAGSAFSVVCSGCGAGATGLALVPTAADLRAPAGSDRARIVLNKPLLAADFGGGNTADWKIRVTDPSGHNPPAGFGTSSDAAGPAYVPCTSPPATAVAGSCGTAPPAVAEILISQDKTPLHYLSAPYPVSHANACGYDPFPACGATRTTGMETVDLDGDGLLDGVRVTFNEALSAHGGISEWCVTDLDAGLQNTCRLLDATTPVDFIPSGAGPSNVILLKLRGYASCATPNVCGPYDTGAALRVSHLQNTAVDLAGNLVPSFQKWATTDAAPPRLVSAKTADFDNNGYIDSAQLNFSEAIKDSSIRSNDWSVDNGYAVSGFATTCTGGNTAADDKCIRLTWSPHAAPATPDTNIQPNIEYAHNAANPLISDLSGLPFQLTVAKANLTDGAPPVMMSAIGPAGATKVRLTFSEPVKGAPGASASSACAGGQGSNVIGSLVAPDLRYIDAGGAKDAATGIASVCDITLSDRIADVFVDQPLNEPADVTATGGPDKICPTTFVHDEPAFTRAAVNVRDVPATSNAAYVPLDASCIPVTKAPGPTFSFTTLDTNHDGYVDAIKAVVLDGTNPYPINDGQMTLGAPILRMYDSGLTGSQDTAPKYLYADMDDSSTVTPGDFRYSDLSSSPRCTPPAVASTPAALAVVQSGDCDAAGGAFVVYNMTVAGAVVPAVSRFGGANPGTVDGDDILFIDADNSGTYNAVDPPALYPSPAPAATGQPAALTGSFLRPGDWQVYFPGHGKATVTSVVTGDKSLTKPGCMPSLGASLIGAPARGALLPDARNDNVFFLCINPITDSAGTLLPDTALLPLLNYTNPNGIPNTGGDQPLGVVSQRPAADGAAPVLLSAQGGAGSNEVTLTFSEGVYGGGGEGLTTGDLSYINNCSDNPPCSASNLARIDLHDANSAVALVSLNAPLTICDVLGSSPGCASLPGGTKGDCWRPRSTVHEAAVQGNAAAFVPDKSCVPIIDNLAPYMQRPRIVDVDGDGKVDAIQVEMNEAIDDSTLADSAAPWTVSYGSTPLRILHVVSSDPSGPASGGAKCGTNQASWPGLTSINEQADQAPAATANDNVFFICLDRSQPSGAGGTSDLGTDAVSAGHKWYVGYNPGSGPAVKDLAGNAMQALPLDPDHLSDAACKCAGDGVGDLARPVVLAIDTQDINGNGRIDDMRVTFSEPVVDSDTFHTGEWSVSGRQVQGRYTGTGFTDNDNVLDLQINEGNVPDTGLCSVANDACPDVSYISGGQLSDQAGKTVRPVAGGSCPAPNTAAGTIAPGKPHDPVTGCVRERDRAPPVILEIHAAVGSASMAVIFSEPVASSSVNPCSLNSAPRCVAVVPGDFDYRDISAGSASGIATVVHTAGENKTALSLNQVVSDSDFAKDVIAVNPGAIIEATDDPTDAVQLQAITAGCTLNGLCADTKAPAAISDLRVVGDLTTDKVIVLNWTQPTDTDIDHYDVRYCQPATGSLCIHTDAEFASGTTYNAGAVTINPGKGAQLAVTLPKNSTAYCFAVKAVDKAGNFGQLPAAGLPVCATTLAPVSGPPGSFTISVTETTPSSIKVSWTAPGETGSSGTVKKYDVAACTTDLSTDISKFNTCLTAAFTTGTIVAAGGTQTATITGTSGGALVANTKYYVAVRAENRGGQQTVSNVVPATTVLGGGTTNPPAAIRDLKATLGPDGVTVTLSWTQADTVSGCTVRDSALPITEGTFASAHRSSFTIVTLATKGATQSASVKDLAAGVHHFAVKCTASGGDSGISAPDVQVTIAGFDQGTLTDINTNIGVTATHASNGNTVHWTNPSNQTPVGYQVWRTSDGGNTWTLACDEVTDGTSCVDADGKAGDQYRVTAYFGDTAASGKATDDPTGLPGFGDQTMATAATSSKILGMPTWLFWAILGGGVLLIVVVLLLVLMGRKGKGQASDAAEGADAWAPADGSSPDEGISTASDADAPLGVPPDADVAPGAPAAAAAASAGAASAMPASTAAPPNPDAPIHYVSCPKCATQFSAQGNKPLAIRCPSCGVRGVLR